MILWIKQETANDTIMLEDNCSHSIYVAVDNKTELKSILEVIGQNETIRSLIKTICFTHKTRRPVMELTQLLIFLQFGPTPAEDIQPHRTQPFKID